MSKRVTCRTCENAQWKDGELFCFAVGAFVDSDAKDHVCANGENDYIDCYSRRERPKLPPEEAHRRLSEAGRKGGSAKRKMRQKTGKTSELKRLHKCDVDALRNYQDYIGAKNFVFAVHEVVRGMVAAHPELKPQSWREYL